MHSYGMLAYTQALYEANQSFRSIHIFRPQIYSYGQCPENKSVMSTKKIIKFLPILVVAV